MKSIRNFCAVPGDAAVFANKAEMRKTIHWDVGSKIFTPRKLARTGGLGSSRGVAAAQGADPHLPIPWFLVAVLQEQVTVLILEASKFQSFTLRLFAVRFPLRFKAASVARVILVALVAQVAHLPSSRWLSFAAPFT